ncbi:MAG: O-antigen ligase family protein [Elusimicrobia bacterium]|nr:O-antigen ligase family protein [Candidatus Liberimonas magnetica]
MQLFNTLTYILLSAAFLIPREYNLRFYGISISITDIAFGIFIIFFLIQYKNRKELIKDSNNRIVLVFLVYLLIISIVQIYLHGISNKHLFFRHIYSYFTITAFLISYNLYPAKKLSAYLVLIFYCFLFVALLSILVIENPFFAKIYTHEYMKFKTMGKQIGYDAHYNQYLERFVPTRTADLMGGFGHLGWVILLCIPLFLSYYESLKKSIPIVIIYVGFATMLVYPFYLMSRTTMIGIFIVGVMLLLAGKYKVNYKKIVVFSAIILLGLFFTGLPQKFVSRFNGLIKGQHDDIGRMNLYIDSAKAVIKHPVLGIGLDGKLDVPKNYTTYDLIDSLYFTIALKIGIIGLAIIVIFILWLIFIGYYYLKKNISDSEENKSFVLAVFCMLPAFLVAGLFAYPFCSISFDIFFWFIMGIYARIIQNSKNKPIV